MLFYMFVIGIPIVMYHCKNLQLPVDEVAPSGKLSVLQVHLLKSRLL
jgi:hypothetical protein